MEPKAVSEMPEKVSGSSQFARDYGAESQAKRSAPASEARISIRSSGFAADPTFQAEAANIGGGRRDGFYKNYRAFYGGATPSTEAPGTKHMAPVFQQ